MSNNSHKMTKNILIVLLLLSFGSNYAQGQKKLWAKSFLNKKAPELIVEKWLSEEPDTQGKFVLIDFWATWCRPCRKLIPDLNNYQEQFNRDLIVIGLSDENEIRLLSFPGTIEYYQATDTKKRTKNKYKVRGIPHTVLIDPDGIVRWEGYPMLTDYLLTDEVIAEIIKKYKK